MPSCHDASPLEAIPGMTPSHCITCHHAMINHRVMIFHDAMAWHHVITYNRASRWRRVLMLPSCLDMSFCPHLPALHDLPLFQKCHHVMTRHGVLTSSHCQLFHYAWIRHHAMAREHGITWNYVVMRHHATACQDAAVSHHSMNAAIPGRAAMP